ncbi:MAG TPA: DUF4156 domain-containing protein [Anaeromyxobacter sp.]
MRIAAALVAIAGAACTAQLTEGGARVRTMPPESAPRCRALGTVEGTGANGASAADNDLAASNDARNRAAKLGANAVVVTQRTSSMWRSSVRAEAYACPQWEPVPGLPPR